MGGYYNLYTVNGSRTFYYRFTCGRCNKTTRWMSYSIEVQHSIQTKRALSHTQLQQDSGLTKKLNEQLNAIKKNTDNGYFFRQRPFSEYKYNLQGKCPHCGQDPKTKGYVFTFGLICGLVGLLLAAITIAVLANYYVLKRLEPAVAIMIIATIVCTIIGTIIASHKERNKVVHSVEYSWNGVLRK